MLNEGVCVCVCVCTLGPPVTSPRLPPQKELVLQAVEKDQEGERASALRLYCSALEHFVPAVHCQGPTHHPLTTHSVCLSVSLPLSLSVCLSLALSVCLSPISLSLSLSLSVCLSPCLSVSLPVCWSLSLSVFLSVCLCRSVCLSDYQTV